MVLFVIIVSVLVVLSFVMDMLDFVIVFCLNF